MRNKVVRCRAWLPRLTWPNASAYARTGRCSPAAQNRSVRKMHLSDGTLSPWLTDREVIRAAAGNPRSDEPIIARSARRGDGPTAASTAWGGGSGSLGQTVDWTRRPASVRNPVHGTHHTDQSAGEPGGPLRSGDG